MHTGLRLRRVASGVFVLALFAVLIVPVGSMARQPNAQTSAGTPKSKVTPVVARAHHTALPDNASDRFQLDPVTPPDAAVEPIKPATSLTHIRSQPTREIQGSDPAVRGPPAL